MREEIRAKDAYMDRTVPTITLSRKVNIEWKGGEVH